MRRAVLCAQGVFLVPLAARRFQQANQQRKVLLARHGAEDLHRAVIGLGEHLLLGAERQLACLHLRRGAEALIALLRGEMRALVTQLHRSLGMTTVLVTHDRELALYADRIITLIDGKTKVESKVRGDDKVVPAMIELCKKRADGVENFDYMIGHTNIKQAEDLEKACRKAFGKAPLVVFELGGVVSANTGPDTVALVYTGHPRG